MKEYKEIYKSPCTDGYMAIVYRKDPEEENDTKTEYPWKDKDLMTLIPMRNIKKPSYVAVLHKEQKGYVTDVIGSIPTWADNDEKGIKDALKGLQEEAEKAVHKQMQIWKKTIGIATAYEVENGRA